MQQIIESVGAILLIISIYKVADSYKYWILYVIACILYIISMLYLQTIPYTIMGIILLVTGIRNYIKGRNYEKENL